MNDKEGRRCGLKKFGVKSYRKAVSSILQKNEIRNYFRQKNHIFMVFKFFIWFEVLIQPFFYLKNFEKYERVDSFHSVQIVLSNPTKNRNMLF